ncbi:MAG: rod shape-determining protein MreD [Halioglobus sp.]
MVNREHNGLWVILLTFAAAYLLAIVALPQWLVLARPEWLALALIYWTIALPHRIGIATAVVLGIGLDVLEGAVFGQNALSLMVVALLSLVLYQRLRVFNVLQQSGTVFILIGVNQLICQWLQNLQGNGSPTIAFLLPAFTSALLWPVVFQILRGLRRHYRVS